MKNESSMKVFFVSFPFDEKNSGDYDYCQKIVNGINQINPSSAEYVTGDKIGFQVADKDNLISELIKYRNNGGKQFYDQLVKYYTDPLRIKLATQIKEYIKLNKATQNILNLQFRPPETGFIFSPEDLEDLKVDGFKICITCHEYKLNYDRRWLQTISHPYFQISDLVLFFNEKDIKNACAKESA